MQILKPIFLSSISFDRDKTVLSAITMCLFCIWSTSCHTVNSPKSSETQNNYDTICRVVQINKNDFITWTDQLQFKYKMHPDQLNQAILYVLQSKSSGLYSGLAILYNDSFEISSVYKITKKNDFELIRAKHLTTISGIDLRSAKAEINFYTSKYYISDGIFELMTFIQNGQLLNGIFYNGCYPENINSVKNVDNKDFLKLLYQVRKLNRKVSTSI